LVGPSALAVAAAALTAAAETKILSVKMVLMTGREAFLPQVLIPVPIR
jgi:hypothetical protein